MSLKKILLYISFFNLCLSDTIIDTINNNTRSNTSTYDLTIVGLAQFADGLGRLSISIMDCLKDDLAINFVTTHKSYNKNDIPDYIQKIINDPNKAAANVSLLTFQPWTNTTTYADVMPNSPIKIAYSMLEGNKIPSQWAHIFNSHFDAVIVPDDYYVTVYKSSGVKIPIFVIPCPLYLKDFLKIPIKKIDNYDKKVFTFGCSANFISAKNLKILLEAFHRTFGNNPAFQLKLHGRYAIMEVLREIKSYIEQYKLTNVKVIQKMFNQVDYINFLKNLNCYVLLSKGEGFSVTPREALAIGIPCILSNNTAHTTICNTGFVRLVNSNIKSPAYYTNLNGRCGYNYGCTITDVSEALREVYQYYPLYIQRALLGRKWVEQYQHENLKNTYLTLVKPKKIILSDVNAIKDNCLITNSSTLYDKYNNIIKATRKNNNETF